MGEETSPEDIKFLESLQNLAIIGHKSEKSEEKEVQNDENEEGTNDKSDEKPTVIPSQQQVEAAGRIEPLRSMVAPEYVRKVIREMDVMSAEMLKQALAKIKIPTNGSKKTLRKRVAMYYRRENMLLNRKSEQNSDKTSRFFDYLIAIDFECTCVEIILDYPHEIIEFPAVLIDVREMKIVSEFRTYVRPVRNPMLSEFCVEFTKISQETVDNAPYFREALLRLYAWMRKFGLGDKNVRFAFVTDGPHDMWKFMQFQCLLSGIRMPHMFRSFINIKKTFGEKFTLLKGNGKSGIENMLEKLGMTFLGTKHSGLDDARNIATIAIELMKRKIELRINERCSYKIVGSKREYASPDASQLDFQQWMSRLPLKLHNVNRKEFLNEEYLDCESCDDLTDDKNDEETFAAKMIVRAELGEDEEFERICEQKGHFEIGEIQQAQMGEPVRRRTTDGDESDSSGDEADSEQDGTDVSTKEEGPDLNIVWSTENEEFSRNENIDSALPIAHSASSESAVAPHLLTRMTMSPPRSYDIHGPPRNSLASANRRYQY